jgi:hypothetical protein
MARQALSRLLSSKAPVDCSNGHRQDVEIKGGLRPSEPLSRFVSPGRGLDALYIEVLHQAFDAEDDTVMTRFRSVMSAILVTGIPLSILTHSELRADNDPADLIELIVQPLRSLLSGINQPPYSHSSSSCLIPRLFDRSGP